MQPGSLVFQKQTLRGFWLHHWYQAAKPEEITAMFDRLTPLVAAGRISAPVAATYDFDHARAEITQAAQSMARCSSRRKCDPRSNRPAAAR